MASEHLIVDGYNIAHSWQEYRVLFKRGVDIVSSKLSEELRIIHDAQGIRTTVVFDGKGHDMVIHRLEGCLTYSVLFTASGVPADAVIEQLVEQGAGRDTVIVASDDRGVCASASAHGAQVLSAEGLRDWVRSASRLQKASLKRRNEQTEKGWYNRIPLD